MGLSARLKCSHHGGQTAFAASQQRHPIASNTLNPPPSLRCTLTPPNPAPAPAPSSVPQCIREKMDVIDLEDESIDAGEQRLLTSGNPCLSQLALTADHAPRLRRGGWPCIGRWLATGRIMHSSGVLPAVGRTNFRPPPSVTPRLPAPPSSPQRCSTPWQ